MEFEWIFRRGDDLIVVHRRLRGDRIWELSVTWPSGETETEGYVDVSSLFGLHFLLERELVRSGWALSNFTPERRRLERRSIYRPRSAARDRRKLGRITPIHPFAEERAMRAS